MLPTKTHHSADILLFSIESENKIFSDKEKRSHYLYFLPTLHHYTYTKQWPILSENSAYFKDSSHLNHGTDCPLLFLCTAESYNILYSIITLLYPSILIKH